MNSKKGGGMGTRRGGPMNDKTKCETCGGQGGWITVEYIRAVDDEWDAVEVDHLCPDCDAAAR